MKIFLRRISRHGRELVGYGRGDKPRRAYWAVAIALILLIVLVTLIITLEIALLLR